MTLDEFFIVVDNEDLTILDRAIYLLWFLGRIDKADLGTVTQLADVMARHGYPRPNVTRLRTQLKADRRTFCSGAYWLLTPRARRELDTELEAKLKLARKIPHTNSVLPRELFAGTRSYLEKVVFQINASYDLELYDCCAVMCRRLLETLIIEVYEDCGRDSEIKTQNGNFFLLAELFAHIEKDNKFNISRNAKSGLRDFKRLGDLSAHNRRHNAVRNDIDRVRDGIRIAAGELAVMAGLHNSTKQTLSESRVEL